MYIEKGEWEKCLETAAQQVGIYTCKLNHQNNPISLFFLRMIVNFLKMDSMYMGSACL